MASTFPQDTNLKHTRAHCLILHHIWHSALHPQDFLGLKTSISFVFGKNKNCIRRPIYYLESSLLISVIKPTEQRTSALYSLLGSSRCHVDSVSQEGISVAK